MGHGPSQQPHLLAKHILNPRSARHICVPGIHIERLVACCLRNPSTCVWRRTGVTTAARQASRGAGSGYRPATSSPTRKCMHHCL